MRSPSESPHALLARRNFPIVRQRTASAPSCPTARDHISSWRDRGWGLVEHHEFRRLRPPRAITSASFSARNARTSFDVLAWRKRRQASQRADGPAENPSRLLPYRELGFLGDSPCRCAKYGTHPQAAPSGLRRFGFPPGHLSAESSCRRRCAPLRAQRRRAVVSSFRRRRLRLPYALRTFSITATCFARRGGWRKSNSRRAVSSRGSPLDFSALSRALPLRAFRHAPRTSMNRFSLRNSPAAVRTPPRVVCGLALPRS